MQQASDTPSSALLRVPNEILWMILCLTMRSDTPVHWEHFLKLGRQYRRQCQNTRTRKNTNRSGKDACEVRKELGTSTGSEGWFLDHLHLGQKEHFRDWRLINSTCRSFRAWGKSAFFSEKIFVVGPRFLNILTGETENKSISTENIVTARACIRDVIARFACGTHASQFMALPRYHVLQRMRSLSIHLQCNRLEVLSSRNLPALGRYPVPEELLTLLRDLGLRVDQLQLSVQHKNAREHRFQMEVLADQAFQILRTKAAEVRLGLSDSHESTFTEPITCTRRLRSSSRQEAAM